MYSRTAIKMLYLCIVKRKIKFAPQLEKYFFLASEIIFLS